MRRGPGTVHDSSLEELRDPGRPSSDPSDFSPPGLKESDADPLVRLEKVFREIGRTRMAGLPILNPALAVEGVDFVAWGGHWLGALVTPWFLNVVLFPRSMPVPRVPEGREVSLSFPSGPCSFREIRLPELPPFLVHPVLSPMTGVASQEEARRLASQAVGNLIGISETSPERVREARSVASRRLFLKGRMGPNGVIG